MKFLLSLFLSLFLLQVQAQKISNLNFDEIKSNVTDSTSSLYYSTLLDRLKQRDTGFTEEEFDHLYYGQVFQDNYEPYSSNSYQKDMAESYKKDKYVSVMKYARLSLVDDPLNLGAMEYMIIAARKWDRQDTLSVYDAIYTGIINAILRSGSGKNKDDAFVVTRPKDEYSVLWYMGLRSSGQSLISSDQGMVDRLTIDKKQAKVKGRKKIKELYFNVSFPFKSTTSKIIKSLTEAMETDSLGADSITGIIINGDSLSFKTVKKTSTDEQKPDSEDEIEMDETEQAAEIIIEELESTKEEELESADDTDGNPD